MRDNLKRFPPNEVAAFTSVAAKLALLQGPRTQAQDPKTHIGREIESIAGELIELMSAYMVRYVNRHLDSGEQPETGPVQKNSLLLRQCRCWKGLLARSNVG
jgi:hypothetical protein